MRRPRLRVAPRVERAGSDHRPVNSDGFDGSESSDERAGGEFRTGRAMEERGAGEMAVLEI